jgi:phosphoribosylanthranilate isomerase
MGRSPDAVLVDAQVPGQAGGTARLVAEHVLAEIPPLPRLILAGGLTPENVAERIARARPWMVDVASGVESSPGRKDPAKVAAFIRAARRSPCG